MAKTRCHLDVATELDVEYAAWVAWEKEEPWSPDCVADWEKDDCMADCEYDASCVDCVYDSWPWDWPE